VTHDLDGPYASYLKSLSVEKYLHCALHKNIFNYRHSASHDHWGLYIRLGLYLIYIYIYIYIFSVVYIVGNLILLCLCSLSECLIKWLNFRFRMLLQVKKFNCIPTFPIPESDSSCFPNFTS